MSKLYFYNRRVFIQQFIPISYKTKYLLVLHVYRFEGRPSKWRTELPGGDHVYQVETIDEIMLTEEDLDNEPLFILHLALVNFYHIFTKFGIHTTMILPQYMRVANTDQKILRAKKNTLIHINYQIYLKFRVCTAKN